MQIPAPAILVRYNVFVACGYGVSACGDGNHKQRFGIHVSHLAPIKPRMRDDDSETRDHQREKCNECEPVRRAHNSSMTESLRLFSMGSRWHRARVAQNSAISDRIQTRQFKRKAPLSSRLLHLLADCSSSVPGGSPGFQISSATIPAANRNPTSRTLP